MRVAIPRMGALVAPCVGHCAMMSIYTIRDGGVADQLDFPLKSDDPVDRVRLLRDQDVDTLICGGIQDVLENILRASGITVISWVSGSVDDLLDLYLRGRLVPCCEVAAAACSDPSLPLHRDQVR